MLHDATNQASNWDPAKFTTYLPPTVDQTDLATLEASGITPQSEESIYKPDHHSFAPRIGISWNPPKMSTTVLRAGYGVFFDTVVANLPTERIIEPSRHA